MLIILTAPNLINLKFHLNCFDQLLSAHKKPICLFHHHIITQGITISKQYKLEILNILQNSDLSKQSEIV